MIYAYDQWALMPTKDIYDTLMMAMAINAAKDMYTERKKDWEKFQEKYEDFYSPFLKDMDRYNQMMDNVRNMVDDAYSNGVDLLRSPEGKTLLRRIQKSIDPAEFNMMRRNAKIGETYLAALGKLRSENKFSQDAEDYRLHSLGLPSFDEFSTSGENGLNTWGEYAPIQYLSLQEATENWYNKRTPYQISNEKAKQILGSSYDPRAKYTGYLDEDLMRVAGENTPGWQGSFWSDYYRDLAKRQLEAEGKDTDKTSVEQRLQRNIADSQQKWIVNPVGSIDDWYKILSVYNGRSKSSGNGNGSNSPKESTSYGLTLFFRGLQNHGGNSDPIQTQKDAYNFGRAVSDLVKPVQGFAEKYGLLPSTATMFANNSKSFARANAAFENRYGRKQTETQLAFNNRFSKDEMEDGKVVLSRSMFPRLFDPQEIYTSTLGYPGDEIIPTNYDSIKSFMNLKDENGKTMPVYMIAEGGDYTAPTKHHNYEQYVWVNLVRSDGATLRKGFKIYETDPVATIPDKDGDQIAVGGYSLLPSQRISNWWSQEDHRLNVASGLSAGETKQGQGYILDTNL